MKLLPLILAVLLVPLARAVPINGDIHINSFGSTATVDFASNTVTFAPSAPSANAQVVFVSGSYGSVTLGTAVTYQNFQYSPLTVTNPIWRIDVDTFFTLTSITSFSEAGGLVLHGTGTASHDGFTPTVGFWSFSADSSGSAFAFSSTTQANDSTNIPGAPDGGTTAALLGMALVGLAALHRKGTPVLRMFQ